MDAAAPMPPSSQTPLAIDIRSAGFGIGREPWLESEGCFARMTHHRGSGLASEAAIVPLCCGVRRALAAPHCSITLPLCTVHQAGVRSSVHHCAS